MKPSRQQNSVWYHNWLHHHDASSRVWRYPEFFSGTGTFFRDQFFPGPVPVPSKKGRILGKKVDILVHYITIVFQLWQNPRHREGPGCHTLASRQTLRCEAYSPLLPEKVLTDSLILVVLCKLHLFHFFHVLVVFLFQYADTDHKLSFLIWNVLFQSYYIAESYLYFHLKWKCVVKEVS